MPAPKVGDEELQEIIEQLTELEKNFAKVMAYNPGISQTQALIQAGSNAKRGNATKLASEMIKRDHVLRYIQFLKDGIANQLDVTLEEIVKNARDAIEMAKVAGKSRDIEPHNRLLAELGGFIKSGIPSNNTQVNVHAQESSTLRSDELDSDIRKLQNIVGVISLEQE